MLHVQTVSYHIYIEKSERICYNEINFKNVTSKGDERSAKSKEENETWKIIKPQQRGRSGEDDAKRPLPDVYGF